MASSAQIKTRFLLLSDTHAIWRPQNGIGQLPKVDVLIHTGDLTMNGKIEHHNEAIALINSIDAELKIVIPGNHDLTLDTDYYTEYPLLHGPRPQYNAERLREIRELYTGPVAKAAGIYYLEEGIETFKLSNGASLSIYASAYTPEFCEWSFAYPVQEDRFNAPDAQNPAPDFIPPNSSWSQNRSKNIDIFITHGPPHTILDSTSPSHGPSQHVGCPHLLTAVSRSRPLLHCFGHIHEGWGAVRKTWSDPPRSPGPTSTSNVRLKAQQPHAAMAQYLRLKPQQIQDSTWDDPGTLYRGPSRPQSTTATPGPVDVTAHVDGTDIKRGAQTLFVNASVLDEKYQPSQQPWVIELMLPRSDFSVG